VPAADGNAAGGGATSGVVSEAEAPRSGALDLHEGISDPAIGGCPRWPEHLRLRSSLGELVRGRCRASNQCAYCARLAAVETAEMLALDALNGSAPRVWMVLTTRSTSTDPGDFYEARRQVLRALRRRWPDLEAAWVLEFTTGYGKRAGGARRPHWNALLKGVGPEDVGQVRDVVERVWCSRVDATAAGQFVGEIAGAGGLMRYLALHFQKESQAPPPGWRGHRFTATRGYLSTPTPIAREAARRALRFKRELWRARAEGRSDPAEIELVAREAMAIADATDWQLVQLVPVEAARAAPDPASLAPLGALGLGPQGPALQALRARAAPIPVWASDDALRRRSQERGSGSRQPPT
jgi:hypothetical protein